MCIMWSTFVCIDNHKDRHNPVLFAYPYYVSSQSVCQLTTSTYNLLRIAYSHFKEEWIAKNQRHVPSGRLVKKVLDWVITHSQKVNYISLDDHGCNDRRSRL